MRIRAIPLAHFQPLQHQRPYFKMNSTIQLAATLCSFGTNEKVRLAIPALLAGDYKAAAEFLGDAFIDVKEELDREKIASDIFSHEYQETIKQHEAEIEDLREQLQDTEARAERFEEMYEDNRGDAEVAKVIQQRFLAKVDELEEAESQLAEFRSALSTAQADLEDLRQRFKDLDAERQRALEDYFSLEAHYTMTCDTLREEVEARSIAEERLEELKQAQKGDAEYIAWLRSEIQELSAQAQLPSTPKGVWGGGVALVEEDMDTEPASPMAAADWETYLSMARQLLEPAYPKFELGPNGCLKDCFVCAKEAENEQVACYAGGQPFCPEKPLASATS